MDLLAIEKDSVVLTMTIFSLTNHIFNGIHVNGKVGIQTPSATNMVISAFLYVDLVLFFYIIPTG